MGGSTTAIETLARVHEIAKRNGNNVCAECPERSVKFASLIKPTVTHETVGVFICEGCYKHHFRMGTHFCETKSLDMATDWTRRDVANLSKSGNDYVNSFYEAKLEGDMSFENDKEIITFDSEEAAKLRASFIKNKYIRRKYYCQQTYMDMRSKRNKEASSTDSADTVGSSSSHSSDDINNKPRRASTGATATGKSSRQQHYASALERNCKEGSTTTTSGRPRRASVGGAIGGGGRRRASLAVRTKIQQNTIMENISERDQQEEEQEDDYSDSYSDDGSSSEEPIWDETPTPPMRAMRRASLNSTTSSSSNPSPALQRRQQRHAQANVKQPSKLESFLDKTQKEHTAATTSKQQRRCHSVVGTEDSRVPASQQEAEPKLFSEKLYDGVVDVSADEMKRLKAAKAARRAKRRSSTATGEGRRPPRRGSSPKGVREETARMSKSMNDNNNRRRNSNRKIKVMPDTSEPAPRSSVRRSGSNKALTGSGLQF